MVDWKSLEIRVAELDNLLSSLSLEPKKRKELQQEKTFITNLLNQHAMINDLERQLNELASSRDTLQDPSIAELYELEKEELQQKLAVLQEGLEELMFPADPLDDASIFVEIRAGTGGQEAALFAGDLLKMYTNYGLSQGWAVSLADYSTTDLGGIREATLHLEGKGCYGQLKHESGVHRVQRVPKTEASGRIHTSTATVAILPEAQEVDIAISPADLRIDTYRAGGAGGQHVNKTDSAVRITHIPTGTVVACQDERSQHKNRAKAMKVLQSRLLASQREKYEAEISQQRKEMVGGGSRSEKVRTYNFPQNRVTDHQIEVTLKKLDIVLQGPALRELIEPLMEKERQDRRKYPLLKKQS